MSREHSSSTSEVAEKLWEDFKQAIYEGDENQVTRILLESSDGRKPHPFLTKKISTTEGKLMALHLAVKNGKESVVKLLIEKGSNVNAVDHPHKCTALHMAVHQLNDNVRIIQLLLEHKDIDVNVIDRYGHTPIKLAAEKGNKEAVRNLLDKGADITIADLVSNTVIHVAADKGHHEVLQLLLPKVVAQNPGIIGSLNKERNTPLHLAVRKQCKKAVALLICYGAAISLNVENQHNETPKQLAMTAAGNKGIIELLENPSKAQQQLQELFRPVKDVKAIGRGGSVEADTGHPVLEHLPQGTRSTLVTRLQGALGVFQPAVIHVSTPELNIKYEYNTELHNGAKAAIGLGAQLNEGGATMTSCVRPQPPAAESSYHVNVSGGSASIGDHSVTNVGTRTPRTPSTAESVEGPFMFPGNQENQDRRTSSSSSENASARALPYSVSQETSSGNPTARENRSDTPGSLPYAVPEVGSAASSAEKAALSYPVPERNNPGTPTENASDADAPGKLPYPVPEESRTQKADAPVTSLNSVRNGVLVGEAGRGDSTNSGTCGPSENRETVTDNRNTTPTSTAGSASRRSSERVIAPSGAAVRATGGGKAACRDELKRSTTSSGNNQNVQATGSSVGAPKVNTVGVSSSKNNTAWGSALQKNGRREDSRRTGTLSRAAPKDVGKRLLQMSNSAANNPAVGDTLQSQRPDLSPEFQQLPVGTESTSKGTVSQPPGVAKKEEKQGDKRGDRLNRVGQFGSPGPPLRVSAEDQTPLASSNAGTTGKASESATTFRISSSSKETPHRKETFLRDDSLPDSDLLAEQSPIEMPANTSTRTATAAEDKSINHAGFIGDSETQASGDVNSSVMDSENAALLQDANPEDDPGGMKRCHSFECTIM